MSSSPVTPRFALLQALISGPGFGLELAERVEERTGGKVKLHQGSLYPSLRALEREGLVESYKGETVPARGGRPRKYYRLTAEGQRAAREEQVAVQALMPAWVVG